MINGFAMLIGICIKYIFKGNAPVPQSQTSFSPVPHLATAQTGPLLELEKTILFHQPAIEAWFRQQWQRFPAPIYASVDLRNAGFKLAPVDTNLFPAGFNNLNPAFDPLCIHALQAYLESICPHACKILLLGENHTRNLFYLESLHKLQTLLNKAGYETQTAMTPSGEQEAPPAVELPSGVRFEFATTSRVGDRLLCGDFDPCLILLNNDLSGGVPDALIGLEQPIIPPVALGWSTRLKSNHFSHYSEVVQEFTQLIPIDPWLIEPLYRNCGDVNFRKRHGEVCVTELVQQLHAKVASKYLEHDIKQKPFIVVKADQGTYGMGVLMVDNGDSFTTFNRQQRKRLSSMKEGLEVSQVIVQEGVYTLETVGEDAAVAEPVIYMIGHYVVGGFYRVHKQRSPTENLNAPGMHFEPLAFAESCTEPDQTLAPDAYANRFYAYGVIARLALLAAAREIDEVTSSTLNKGLI